MRHADYKYVNVAVGGVFNRKGIYDFRQLGDPSGLNESYCTYFRYNDDMKDHFQSMGSVKKYHGSAFADWLPIDIDSDDLQQAQYYLQHLVQNMDDEGIDTSYTLVEGTLAPGESATYNLRLWIDETAGNDVMNNSFTGRVLIYSYM